MNIRELLEPYSGKMNNDSYDDEDLEFSTTIGDNTYGFLFRYDKDNPWNLLNSGMQIIDDEWTDEIVKKYNLFRGGYVDCLMYLFVFYLLDEGGGRNYEITGSGSVATVFAAVKSAFDTFMEKTQGKFDILTFSAKEKSRIRLYDRFASMLVKTYGWALETYDTAIHRNYVFINTNNNTAKE